MLEPTTSVSGARPGVVAHHDDAAREHDYDRKSAFGNSIAASTRRAGAAGSWSA
jgi:hypothetical protein